MRLSIGGVMMGVAAGLLCTAVAWGEGRVCPETARPAPTLVYEHLHLPDLHLGEVPEPGPDLVGTGMRSGADNAGETGSTNLAFRLDTEEVITPFLEAKMDSLEAERESELYSDLEIIGKESPSSVYLLSAGIGCALGGNAQMDLGYRYTTGNLPVPVDAPDSSRLKNDESHNISINLKFVY